MTIQQIAIFACILITIYFIWKLSQVSPIGLVLEAWDCLMAFLANRSKKKYKKHEEIFAVMSKKEKQKNLSYRFHSFVNEILLDIGWKTKKITVEGFNTFIFLITSIVTVIFGFYLKSIFLTIFFGCVLFILIYALIFLLSRLSHTQRKIALMDAEDFLCSSMSQGLTQAIEENIEMIDRRVQLPFREYLDSIYNRNMDISKAIDNLNEGCGEQFDDFCEKCKIFERERRPGMEDVFQYNISRNAFVRELDRECSKTFTAMNRNYLASIGIIIGFIVYNMMAYYDIREFYLSPLGRVLLMIYFTISAVVFIYLQYIQSKPFKYGNR